MKSVVKIVFIIVVIAVFSSGVKECKTRCDYENHNGKLCYKFHEIPLPWHEGELRCHMQGGIMLTPFNEDHHTVFNHYAEKFNPNESKIYTGLSSRFSWGDFQSVEARSTSDLQNNNARSFEPYYNARLNHFNLTKVSALTGLKGIPLHRIEHTWDTNQPWASGKCIAWKDRKFQIISCATPLPYICYMPDVRPSNKKCGINDNEYVYNEKTKHCYKFHRRSRTWSRAFMMCTAEMGKLLVINNNEEAKFIEKLFEKNPIGTIVPQSNYQSVAHIGFQDWGEHSSWNWRTIDGTVIDNIYNKWAKDEPKNSTGEFCGALERAVEIDDYYCDKPLAFICEKEATFKYIGCRTASDKSIEDNREFDNIDGLEDQEKLDEENEIELLD